MFYVMIKNGRAVSTTEKYPERNGSYDRRFENRNDWKSFERVTEIAEQLNAAREVPTAPTYIPVDNGSGVSPRYDVIEAPRLGDVVSRGFNGDYYPEGTIVKISASLRRIETSTGAVFFRKRQSARWSDGTFSMVAGTIDERNPSF